MILECPSCQTRFNVQSSLFAAGGRRTRCARCKHEWHAVLPASADVAAPPPEAAAPVPDKIAPIARSPSPPSAPSHSPPPLGQDMSAPETLAQPVVSEKSKRLRFAIIAVLVLAGALLAWLFLEHDAIIRAYPALQGFYGTVGLQAEHSGQGLAFDQVKSEIKYDGGTMRLFVDGVVHNGTADAQFIPDIKARALGPDRRTIQSWWVPAPAAMIAAGSDVPFHTEIATPMKQTIEDVYLEFYPQDEQADVKQ